MTSIPEHARQAGTPAASTRNDWKNTVLAGLANYIDAGSIVAGSVALAIWAKQFHLTSNFLGLIVAFSSNAISAGIGALIGGRLCDRVGRKKIYQWDMLVYAVGMLVLVFAVKPWMIVVGFVLAGLAGGADIPASWTSQPCPGEVPRARLGSSQCASAGWWMRSRASGTKRTTRRSGSVAQLVEVSPSPLAWACLRWGLAERQCSVMAALETAAQPHHTEANPEMVSRAMMMTAMRLTMPKIATLR